MEELEARYGEQGPRARDPVCLEPDKRYGVHTAKNKGPEHNCKQIIGRDQKLIHNQECQNERNR